MSSMLSFRTLAYTERVYSLCRPPSRRPPRHRSVTMPGKRGHNQPLSIDDAKKFIDAYLAERDIDVAGDRHSTLKACRERAEIARDTYKGLNGAGISKPASRAEKYERRLLNNRKSAAAMRVFHEVEDVEQKHMIAVACSKLEKARKKKVKVKKTLEALRVEVSRLTNVEIVEKPVAAIERNEEQAEAADCATDTGGKAEDVTLSLNAPGDTMPRSIPGSLPEPLLSLPPFASFGIPESGFVDGEHHATDEMLLNPFSFSQNENIFGVEGGGDRSGNPA